MLSKENILKIKAGLGMNLLLKYKIQFSEFFIKLKKQFEYNDDAREILKNYYVTKTISTEDAKKLKEISADTLKLVGLSSIVILPGGSLLLLFLINSAKKLNINIIPSQFEKEKTE